ncbi:ARF GAP-like zinc finger-containing protein [Histomonas meleagridis]|uniref:ARF GAP-like zinc finger-containing protein n=1 Tax=Histomonas meleagridis TaxID=135588 RepID=UPI00355A93A4|nr:ARF GAP-like zinc finger-containing protein [Histomonas meleagridis]KAH0804589.1 ARF GAP-like zinc finger-containing protein [Histomonas meleagridis]
MPIPTDLTLTTHKQTKMSFDPLPFANLHNNPMFIMEHQERYQQVYQLGNQLKKISKLVRQYTQTGFQLCQNINDIANGFDSFELICTNSSYRKLVSSILEVSKSLQSHFQKTEDENKNELKRFVKKEFPSFIEAQKAQARELDKYYAAQERYLAVPRKGKQPKSDKYSEYTKAYESSCLSFFDFVTSIDETEAKINNTIGAFFTSFALSLVNATTESLRDTKEACEIVLKDSHNAQADLVALDAQSKINRDIVISKIPGQLENLNNPFTSETKSKQGYLWRKRGKLTKTWEKYFFVCMNGTISASLSPETAHNPSLSIPLQFVSINFNTTEDRAYVFNLITKDKIFVLQAPSQYDLDEWVAAIQGGIAEVLSGPPKKRSASLCHKDAPHYCADCGKQDANWLLMNRNMTLCDQCAGVHRAIANVSVVRSLKLDTINPYNLRLLELYPNNPLNKYYEFNVGNEKITEVQSREERDAFIRKKYVDKQYLQKLDSVPNPFKAISEQNPLDLLVAALYDNLGRKLSGRFLPIHAAACVGNPLLIVIICMNSRQINRLDANGWSALSYATYFKNISAVNALLAMGADINAAQTAHPLAIAMNSHCKFLISKFSSTTPLQVTTTTVTPPTDIPFHPIETPKEQVVNEPINEEDEETNNEQQQQQIEKAIHSMQRRNTINIRRKQYHTQKPFY